MTCIEDNAGLLYRGHSYLGWAILPPHPTSQLLITALNFHLGPTIPSLSVPAVALAPAVMCDMVMTNWSSNPMRL